MPDVPDNLQRLADAVTERRQALGLTRVEVHRNGGPADTTLARIETPTPTTTLPRPTTLRRLDAGLQWPEGTAASKLHGSATGGGPGHSRQLELSDALSFTTIDMPVSIISDLVQAGDLVLADLQPGEGDQLRAVIQQLTAIYATEVLERVGGPGAVIPPAIAVTFRPHLDAPLSTDESVRSEQLYRRWLAGVAAAGTLGDLAPSFEARWRAKRRDIMLRSTTA